MNPTLPITIEEFKSYFCQDKGFEFQPYVTWKKTVFDTGDYALLNNVFYVSTIDKNIASPDSEDSGFEKLTDVYEKDIMVPAGRIVFYNNKSLF